MRTSIAIDDKTKERFDKHLEPRESSDSLLNRLLDVFEDHQQAVEWEMTNHARNYIEKQRERRRSDPDHPCHKWTDKQIMRAINSAIRNCNRRISKKDVIVELAGKVVGIGFYKKFSRREIYYLNWRINNILNEKYQREDNMWLVKECAEAWTNHLLF
jgi:hypothetical protein